MRSRTPGRGPDSDGGFTLVETMVAIWVVSTVLLSLGYIQSSALLTTAAARQREQATLLATRVMEQVRAMPYVALSAGLNSGDLSGDPDITGGRFRPSYNTSIDEEILASPTQTQPPLYPHVQLPGAAHPELTVGPATYSVSVYVTKTATWTATEPVVWLTVIAKRLTGPSPGHKPVALRSQAFSPDGCLSTSTRPYSGPCQAYFYGSAGTTQGRIWLDRDGTDAIPELGLDKGQLDLPTVSVAGQAEQSTSLESKATTAGLQTTIGGAESSSGLVSAGVQVDNDPASSLPDNPPAVTASQSVSGLSSTGSFGTLTLDPASGGSVTAMGGAASSNAVPCPDPAGATTASGLPCGSAAVSGLGAQSATVTPAVVAGRSLGAFALAQLAAPGGSPGQAWTARLAATEDGHCPALTTGGTVGCSAAAASRAMGTLMAGGAPPINGGDVQPGAVPFTGMVRVTGYTASGTSEQGIGAGAASTARSASISYWNGSSYSVAALDPLGMSVDLGTAVIDYKSAASTIRFTLDGTVSAVAASSVTTGPMPTCADACTTKTEVPSVVVRPTSCRSTAWRRRGSR